MSVRVGQPEKNKYVRSGPSLLKKGRNWADTVYIYVFPD